MFARSSCVETLSQASDWIAKRIMKIEIIDSRFIILNIFCAAKIQLLYVIDAHFRVNVAF